MKIIFSTIVFLFFISNLAIANVPPPPQLGSKGIELQQDYPDYVFYFGKYYVFDENGKSISKIDLEKIELTNLTPFVIEKPKDLNLQYFKEKHLNTNQVKFSVREDYLIAVKNEVHNQIKTKLPQQLIDLINLKKNGDGIYYAAIPKIGLKSKYGDVWYGRYESRMVVSRLDDNGLEFQVVRFQEGDNHYIDDPEAKNREAERTFRTIAVLVGIILGVSALIIAIGIYIFRKKRKIA